MREKEKERGKNQDLTQSDRNEKKWQKPGKWLPPGVQMGGKEAWRNLGHYTHVLS